MALTYDQHKAAIDAAYPTPPIEWVRQDDHVTFGLYEVASAELTFNGQSYHYLGAHYRIDGEEGWKIRRFVAFGGRVSLDGWYVSWDDAKTAFATYWEAHCERERVLLATSAYGKDVVDDAPGRCSGGAAGIPCTWALRRKPPSRSIRVSSTRGLNTPPRPLSLRLR